MEEKCCECLQGQNSLVATVQHQGIFNKIVVENREGRRKSNTEMSENTLPVPGILFSFPLSRRVVVSE